MAIGVFTAGGVFLPAGASRDTHEDISGATPSAGIYVSRGIAARDLETTIAWAINNAKQPIVGAERLADIPKATEHKEIKEK